VSWAVAFAEMVMIAFKKSPAAVCVADGYSGDSRVSSNGIKFCDCSHCQMLIFFLRSGHHLQLLEVLMGLNTHVDDTLPAFTSL